MKTRLVDMIRPCDFCGEVKDHYYDAPTLRAGAWANMCPDCLKKHGAYNAKAIGTMFVLRDRSNQKAPASGILDGKELNSMEDIVLEGERGIECPNCGEIRYVEPDATYTFECDGCKSKVRVPCLGF